MRPSGFVFVVHVFFLVITPDGFPFVVIAMDGITAYGLPYNDYIEHVTRTSERLVDIHAGKVAPVTKEGLGFE